MKMFLSNHNHIAAFTTKITYITEFYLLKTSSRRQQDRDCEGDFCLNSGPEETKILDKIQPS